MSKFLLILSGLVLGCSIAPSEKNTPEWSLKAYYDLLPSEMTLYHIGGILNEVDDTLRLVLDEENRYMAYHLNYYGEDYVPFQMKLFPVEGEKEPLIVVNQYVWDVGDPFYQTHIIQFDEGQEHFTSKMAEVTAAITGRKNFFEEEAWVLVRKILECQKEDMGYEMFPEVAFVVEPEKESLNAILDGIDGFVDWCGLSLEEWEKTLAAYQSLHLDWDEQVGIFKLQSESAAN